MFKLVGAFFWGGGLNLKGVMGGGVFRCIVMGPRAEEGFRETSPYPKGSLRTSDLCGAVEVRP